MQLIDMKERKQKDNGEYKIYICIYMYLRDGFIHIRLNPFINFILTE